jgi:hypothetical protein
MDQMMTGLKLMFKELETESVKSYACVMKRHLVLQRGREGMKTDKQNGSTWLNPHLLYIFQGLHQFQLSVLPRAAWRLQQPIENNVKP